MSNAISDDAAAVELQRIADFFEVDQESQTWRESKSKLLAAIKKGRVILDEEKSAIITTLCTPIELDNGSTIGELAFHEPNASDLKVLDRYKDHEAMAKTIHLCSKMTGQPCGVIERLGSRDLQTAGGLASLFF